MIPDYLSPDFQAAVSESPSNNNDVVAASESSFGTTVEWRNKICEWCYNFVDHCDLERGSVSVAMNILDRYVSTHHVTDKIYTFAAMTALHIGIKLHCQYKISLKRLLQLCGGSFTVDEVESMEIKMLDALSWRVNPPTSVAFCGELIDSSFTETAPNVLEDLQALANYFTELAVLDYFFVERKPSSIAVAAIMYAMELTFKRVDPRDKDCFFSTVSRVDIDVSDREVDQCLERMRSMYKSNLEYEEEGLVGELEERQGSPVCLEELTDTTASKKRKRVMTDDDGRLVTEHGEKIACCWPV